MVRAFFGHILNTIKVAVRQPIARFSPIFTPVITPLSKLVKNSARKFVPRAATLLAVFVILVSVVSAAGVFTYTRGQASAATSNTLNFQARLLGTSGALVADGSYNIEFKIYKSLAAGTSAQSVCSLNASTDDCYWLETRAGANTVTVKNGYFNVSLGSVTAFSASVPWDQDLYLSMSVGGIGGPAWDTEMSPRFHLTAVPYAFKAGKVLDAAGANSFTADDLIQKSPTVIQTLNSALAAVRLNQTGSGGLLQLQGASSDVFTVDKLGNTVVAGNLNVNGNTTIGAANTNRLTINAQLLGTNALVFQGATDNAFTTTFQITNPTGTNSIIFPDASGTVQLAPASGSYLQQVPTGSINTISPTTSGVTGLTVNGTTNATSAAVAVFNQANSLAATPGDTLQANSTNTAGIQTNGLLIARNGAGGTTTNLLNLTNTAGTATNGLNFTGTFATNLISAPNFSVANSGAILSPSINAAGIAATAVGNSTGGVNLAGTVTSAGNLNANGNTTLGDVTTDRLTVNAQLLGANALVFQGATDNAFTTTFSLTDPTANRTITIPDLTGTLDLLETAQSFSGLKTFGAGLTVTTGQNFTINGDVFTDLTGTGLVDTANALSVAYGSTAATAVQGNVALTCPSGSGNLTGGGTAITLGTGGTCGAISTNNAVSFTTSVTSPIFTSTGAVTLSSAAANGLTLDSGNNILSIASTDTTLQRIATGNFTIDLSDASGTTLVLNNSGAGAADINLNDGGLLTAGTSRLTNGGVLQNITGLTVASGGASITGTATFVNNIAANGNTTLGDATTDRVTLTAQILGGSPLVFQGATDDAFTTTFAVTDPTANRTITIPNESGIIALIGPAAAQVDAGTNSALFINKTGASGNLLTLQKGGTGVFTIANDGSTNIHLTATAALLIDNSSSTAFFSVDTNAGVVRVGDPTADATGTVLVLDTKNTAGDPTGLNGAEYYNSFTQSFRCYRAVNGTTADGVWQDCTTNSIDHGWKLEDEFLSGNISAFAIGSLGWNLQTIATAATPSYNNLGTLAPTSDRPGILRLRTNGNVNRGSTMSLSGSGLNPAPIGAGMVIRSSVSTFKNAGAQAPIVRVGQHSETTAITAPTSGVWWEANSAVSLNWQYCYGTGLAANCNASTVAITDNVWSRLEIRVVSTTAVDFFINGTKISITGITLDTAAQTAPALTCYAGVAVAQDCFIDYYQISGGSGTSR